MKKDGKHLTPFSPKSSCMPAILAKNTGTGCSAASKNLVNLYSNTSGCLEP